MARPLAWSRARARALPAAAIVAAVIATASSAALADEPSAIDKGIALYEDLEYEAAARVLSAAVATPGLSRESKILGLKVLGLSQTALGEMNAARDSFRRLLELDRDFKLDARASPQARALLEEVRLDLPGQVSIAEREPPRGGRASSPLTLSIALDDPSSLVSGVVIHYRGSDSAEFSTVQATPVNKKGDFTATIPGAFVTTPSMRYYVTARSASGKTLASLGDGADPLTIAVLAAASGQKRSVLRSPWLWAGVGAVAVGGGVAAFFLLRDDPGKGFINIIAE